MTPRQRVLRAISHQSTDRVPADFHAHAEVADRLRRHLGLPDHESLLQHLAIDMRRVSQGYHLPDAEPDGEGYVRSMWGLRTHPDKTADDPTRVLYPFHEDSTVDEVYSHPWPQADRLDYDAVREQCARWGGEFATYGSPWCPFFHEVGWLVGQENYYAWMCTRPDLVAAITECIVDFEIAVCERFFAACDGLLDIAFFGNDFGTQRGLFVSPGCFGRLLREPLKRFFDVAHRYGCRVMQHSCGSVRAILPWLIEDGVDVLNPVQVRAAAMDLPGLVADFGGRIAFHGGVDTQYTLPFGTPDDVRAQVRSYRDLTRDRGGYVLCSSQDLIADIPDGNILAMYEMDLRY